MSVDTPLKPPFTNAGALKTYLAEKVYSRDPEIALTNTFAFYGVSDMQELMALPARTNSGELGTMASCWFGLFPFVDMASQWVAVDDVAIGGDGYSLLSWCRWNGECGSAATLPSGETIDLAGHSFRDLRYAYRLTFSTESKKVVLFEGLFDMAEWGRLMDSPAFAAASARTAIYPT